MSTIIIFAVFHSLFIIAFSLFKLTIIIISVLLRLLGWIISLIISAALYLIFYIRFRNILKISKKESLPIKISI